MNPSHYVSENIKYLRETFHLTRAKLSSVTGVPAGILEQLEHNQFIESAANNDWDTWIVAVCKICNYFALYSDHFVYKSIDPDIYKDAIKYGHSNDLVLEAFRPTNFYNRFLDKYRSFQRARKKIKPRNLAQALIRSQMRLLEDAAIANE
jgi:hypothetical protein